MIEIPTAEAIQTNHEMLIQNDWIVETPLWKWSAPIISERLGPKSTVSLKLELFQRTGTFKPRGALTVMSRLASDQLRRGVSGASAGNHAIAVAYAAQILGTTAKVVMTYSANPARVRACQRLGAEIIRAPIAEVFLRAEALQQNEGRFAVHAFEGPLTALGTAGVGYEIVNQDESIDAVVVAVGGGGLCAGVAAAVKQFRPHCEVFAVEPRGANTMYLSFRAGSPQSIKSINTIADSLGAPHAAPYSFAVCRRFVDELVLVSDSEIVQAMKILAEQARLAVEPAGAAATAAMFGPLRERLQGKHTCLVICGSTIDAQSYASYLNS